MGKIFIVDADHGTTKQLEFILSIEGYDVITLNESCNTISVAETHHPNLILPDLMMPDSDRLEVCRNLRGPRSPALGRSSSSVTGRIIQGNG